MSPDPQSTAEQALSVPGRAARLADLMANADLAESSDDTLADALHTLREYDALSRDWRKRIEGELRDRLGASQRAMLLTDHFEVRLKFRNESVWDADELEAVVRDLIDHGVLRASEVTELIRHETIVSRSQANRLLDRLAGPAHRAVEACRTWRQQSGSTLDVTPSTPLLKEET